MQTARFHLVAVIAALVLVFAAAGPVHAGEADDFQAIISSQLEAFQRDDGSAAFSHASPGIRGKFQTAERFMDMVRNGYAPVYRPKRYSFGRVSREFAGRPTQHVVFIDQTGRVWTALYAFERQPDGTWKIDGVAFTKTDEIVS
jgi:hypothetical protein